MKVTKLPRFSAIYQTLTAAGAQAALSAARRMAAKHNWAVSIAVTDSFGNLLAFHRMDGAPVVSIAVTIEKATTAAQARMPSKQFQDMISDGNISILSVPGIVSVEGGVPIKVGEIVVGAIAASGVQSSQDAHIAQAGADFVANRIHHSA